MSKAFFSDLFEGLVFDVSTALFEWNATQLPQDGMKAEDQKKTVFFIFLFFFFLVFLFFSSS